MRFPGRRHIRAQDSGDDRDPVPFPTGPEAQPDDLVQKERFPHLGTSFRNQHLERAAVVLDR